MRPSSARAYVLKLTDPVVAAWRCMAASRPGTQLRRVRPHMGSGCHFKAPLSAEAQQLALCPLTSVVIGHRNATKQGEAAKIKLEMGNSERLVCLWRA